MPPSDASSTENSEINHTYETTPTAYKIIRARRLPVPQYPGPAPTTYAMEMDESRSEGELDQILPSMEGLPRRLRRLPYCDVNSIDGLPLLPNALFQRMSSMGFSVSRFKNILAAAITALLSTLGDRKPNCTDLIGFYVSLFSRLLGNEDGLLRPFPASGEPSDLSLSADFDWPIFEMVDFEYGGASDKCCLEHVMVVINLPNLGDLPGDLERLLRLMLIPVGSVKSLVLCNSAMTSAGYDETKKVPTSPSEAGEASQAAARGQSIAFVELESIEQLSHAVTSINGFPFSTCRILQARRFREYGRDEASTHQQENEAKEGSLRARKHADDKKALGLNLVYPAHALLSPKRDDISSDAESHHEADLSTPRSDASFSSNSTTKTAESGHVVESRDDDEGRLYLPRYERLLELLRGPNDAEMLRELEVRLRLGIERRDGLDIRWIQRRLVRSYLVATGRGEMNEAEGEIIGELESLIDEMFDDAVLCPSKLWRQCYEVECLRSAEMLRRLRMTTQQQQQLLQEAEQKHHTIDLLQSQRCGMLQHVRQLRIVNQSLSARNHNLMCRLQGHRQIAGQVECMQARLRECEARMAKMATESMGRGEAEADVEGSQSSSEELAVIEKKLEARLTELRAKRQEKIKDERTKLMRDKEVEEAQKLCCICQEEQKSVLLLPCRHLCVCRPCAERPELESCPVCRALVYEKLKVFA